MSFEAPLKIELKSDGNELIFISVKNGVYSYRYTRSHTKLNKILSLREDHLIKLINSNKIIQNEKEDQDFAKKVPSKIEGKKISTDGKKVIEEKVVYKRRQNENNGTGRKSNDNKSNISQERKSGSDTEQGTTRKDRRDKNKRGGSKQSSLF